MRYLTSRDVSQLLPMSTAIELMRGAFRELGSGDAVVPVRTVLPMGSQADNCTLVMPASLPSYAAGLKLISVVPGNAAEGRPISSAVVLVVDPEKGDIRAIIEAETLTAIRTGAGSGLATDLMASEDATVVAIVGAGRQAETQLEAVTCVRSIERAIVFNRSSSRAAAFASKMSDKLGISVIVAASEDQLREADIVCTATSSSKPVIASANLSERVHINGVGSYRPDMAEIPAHVVARAVVIADHIPACLKEAGDLLQPISSGLVDKGHIAADLGQLLNGTEVDFSRSPWTFFKSVGIACQDIAVGHYLVQRAEEDDVGIDLPHIE